MGDDRLIRAINSAKIYIAFSEAKIGAKGKHIENKVQSTDKELNMRIANILTNTGRFKSEDDAVKFISTNDIVQKRKISRMVDLQMEVIRKSAGVQAARALLPSACDDMLERIGKDKGMSKSFIEEAKTYIPYCPFYDEQRRSEDLKFLYGRSS